MIDKIFDMSNVGWNCIHGVLGFSGSSGLILMYIDELANTHCFRSFFFLRKVPHFRITF